MEQLHVARILMLNYRYVASIFSVKLKWVKSYLRKHQPRGMLVGRTQLLYTKSIKQAVARPRYSRSVQVELEAAAKVLSMTADELSTALQSDKTLD